MVDEGIEELDDEEVVGSVAGRRSCSGGRDDEYVGEDEK